MARILVVDDDPLSRKLLSLTLKRAGYDVLTAADAQTADRRLLGVPPDLILMDLELPGKDGCVFARELRTRPSTARVPIVALTAYPERYAKSSARLAGCDDFLTKPVAEGDLRYRLGWWISNAKRAAHE